MAPMGTIDELWVVAAHANARIRSIDIALHVTMPLHTEAEEQYPAAYRGDRGDRD
jgi:hypothetical protein